MTTRIGPVLVGTDFSDSSRLALEEAQRLALLVGTAVQILHVIDRSVTGMPMRGSLEAASGACQLDTWLRAAGLGADSLVVRYGSAWVELMRFAGEIEPSLIVAGSHGQSGYQPLAVGSTAARLAIHSRWPVVLVSPRSATREWGLAADAARERAVT